MPIDNGRATLRDMISLQKSIFDKIERIEEKITNLRLHVAVISVTVSTLSSLCMTFLILLLKKLF
ncbi:hypothetical protein A2V82_12065 [candidate division KSB1 bacterium RBG_16_48_16]|nr:MAG: hypothetical protein A2V82_12065 [candidate division KSB1 bacterium RBG_16_48_16]